jgi:hypothetical protein
LKGSPANKALNRGFIEYSRGAGSSCCDDADPKIAELVVHISGQARVPNPARPFDQGDADD